MSPHRPRGAAARPLGARPASESPIGTDRGATLYAMTADGGESAGDPRSPVIAAIAAVSRGEVIAPVAPERAPPAPADPAADRCGRRPWPGLAAAAPRADPCRHRRARAPRAGLGDRRPDADRADRAARGALRLRRRRTGACAPRPGASIRTQPPRLRVMDVARHRRPGLPGEAVIARPHRAGGGRGSRGGRRIGQLFRRGPRSRRRPGGEPPVPWRPGSSYVFTGELAESDARPGRPRGPGRWPRPIPAPGGPCPPSQALANSDWEALRSICG